MGSVLKRSLICYQSHWKINH